LSAELTPRVTQQQKDSSVTRPKRKWSSSEIAVSQVVRLRPQM